MKRLPFTIAALALFLASALCYGAPIVTTIDADPPLTVTQDNTPTDVVLFEGNPNSSIVARILIICRRPSDGATKVWDLSAAMRMGAFNALPVNLANRDGLAFGAALDLTALAGTTISFFATANPSNIGVTLTGLSATTLEWGIQLKGIQVID